MSTADHSVFVVVVFECLAFGIDDKISLNFSLLEKKSTNKSNIYDLNAMMERDPTPSAMCACTWRASEVPKWSST